MSEITDSRALDEYAAAEGMRVAQIPRRRRIARALRWFAIHKPLGAIGVLLVIFWSIAAVGTIGDGGGWLGIGRYDSAAVFNIANVRYADDKIADAIDGLPASASASEFRAILSDPAVFGELAEIEGVAGEMVAYAEGLIAEGGLVEHLATVEPPQIEVDGGVITDVDSALAAGTNTATTTAAFLNPSGQHWFGTDRTGKDLYSRVMEGARISLYIGVGATLIGVIAGTVIGLISGVSGGAVDLGINRVMDAMQVFPPLVFLLLLRSVTEPSTLNVMLALSVLAVAPVQRIVRGAVIALRDMPFVEAARAMGANNLRVMLIHVLPNIVAPLIVIFSITIGAFILAEAFLSFLGLGTIDVSWGKMISDGRQFIVASPWTSLFSGLALTSLVFGFNVLGDALRDIFDPRLRGSR